jgi:hypothetical protein
MMNWTLWAIALEAGKKLKNFSITTSIYYYSMLLITTTIVLAFIVCLTNGQVPPISVPDLGTIGASINGQVNGDLKAALASQHGSVGDGDDRFDAQGGVCCQHSSGGRRQARRRFRRRYVGRRSGRSRWCVCRSRRTA